jgi:hypothetical protein
MLGLSSLREDVIRSFGVPNCPGADRPAKPGPLLA